MDRRLVVILDLFLKQHNRGQLPIGNGVPSREARASICQNAMNNKRGGKLRKCSRSVNSEIISEWTAGVATLQPRTLDCKSTTYRRRVGSQANLKREYENVAASSIR